MEAVNTGETLDNSPLPAASRNAKPLAEAAGAEIPPIAKAYFMHTWVEALYSIPQNKNPNPAWSSPLKDPVDVRVWCTDCHVNTDIDFGKIPKTRLPVVDQLERDKTFMVDLMTKWVTRLNSDEFKAKAKLKGEVKCLTCHATDPTQN